MAGDALQPRLDHVPGLGLVDGAHGDGVAEAAIERGGGLIAGGAGGQAGELGEGDVVGGVAEAGEVVGGAAGEGGEEAGGVGVVGVVAEGEEVGVAAAGEDLAEVVGVARDLEVDAERAQGVAQDRGLLQLGLVDAGPVAQDRRGADLGGGEDLAGLLEVGGRRGEAVEREVVLIAAEAAGDHAGAAGGPGVVADDALVADGVEGEGDGLADGAVIGVELRIGVLADVRVADYPLVGQGMAWGVALHKGKIFVGAYDGRLIALDALSGRPCPGFGKGGEVSLKEGMGITPDGYYSVTSPPAVAQ